MLLASVTKADIQPMPEYFDRYINLTEDVDLDSAFSTSIKQIWSLDVKTLDKLALKTYAPGKWTVNEILQHIADTERLLAAGVIRFARNQSDYTISFNEEEMASAAQANKKPVEHILQELIDVRKATWALYRNLDESDFTKIGINWKYEISVAAMGFNIIGHQMHHLNIISEKYHPLLQATG